MTKKNYIIKNLHCASCATKIENNIKKMNIVEDLTLDFYSSELHITLKEEIEDDVLLPKLNFICDKVEPGTYLEQIKTLPPKEKKIILKRIYSIKNLHCANCASKIEANIKKMNIVEEVVVDFYSSQLNITLKEEVEEDILLPKLNFICDKVEPGTYLEKTQNLSSENKKDKIIIQKNYIIRNLHCANCASKIENDIRKINIVEDLTLDFYSSELHITLKEETKDDVLLPKLNFICDKVEPGTYLEQIQNFSPENKEHEHHHNFNINDTTSNKEETAFLKREHLTNSCLAFGAILFAISFFIDSLFIKNTILVVAYIFTGATVVTKSFKNILRGNFLDENFLMTIATFGAFLLGDFSEAVAVMIFYMVGEHFQERAVNNSKKSIESLLSLKALYANLKKSTGEIEKVAPEDVRVGDIITVKTGEKIPLDGVVILGETQVDNSALTGESVPIPLSVGSNVLSGGINLGGVFDIKVSTEFSDSTINRIIELVKNAHSRKPKAEKFVTIFARYYTPAIVILAILIAFIPPLVFNMPFSLWMGRALIFLVISCPCALVLSIPLTFFSSIGYASRHGLLIKGGNYLEALSKIDTVVFDKTGTITKGNFKVNEIITNNTTPEEVIIAAKAAEYFSNHPIAKAIMEYSSSSITPELIEKHREIAGRGVYVQYKGDEILVGNAVLLKDENINFTPISTFKTSIYVAKNGVFLGTILISDEIKPHAETTIKELKDMGLNLYMLTGDSKVIAENIGAQVGLDQKHIFANLLPENKVERLEEIKAKSKNGVIFIGDGINDAPVLSLADVGIAMGGIGSDIAIESSDVVIMNDEFEKVHQLLVIAKKNRRILFENIIFALGVKILIMILGVLGYASLWLAIFGDVGVSLIAVLNASKILKKK